MFRPPRTCAHCGGANPDDILDLIRQGWEVEGTPIAYKKYLHPPGFAARTARALSLPKPENAAPDYVGYVEPFPAVKVYVYHMSPEHIREYNTIVLSTKQV